MIGSKSTSRQHPAPTTHEESKVNQPNSLF
jgi:hypothetical protein